MTKDDATTLGMTARKAQEYFLLLGIENTQADPAKRAEQTERYERARADMYEATNRHRAALDGLR